MTEQEKKQIEQRTLLEIQHREWLNHPITKQLKNVLDNHQKAILDHIKRKAKDENIPDNKIRIHAVQLETNDTIQQLIFDTNTYANNAK